MVNATGLKLTLIYENQTSAEATYLYLKEGDYFDFDEGYNPYLRLRLDSLQDYPSTNYYMSLKCGNVRNANMIYSIGKTLGITVIVGIAVAVIALIGSTAFLIVFIVRRIRQKQQLRGEQLNDNNIDNMAT